MALRKSDLFGYAAILVFAGAGMFILYDVLLSKPQHQTGIIVEKIFVPARNTAGSTPYGGVRRGIYYVATEKDAQWIAMVKINSGEVLSVHCMADHYASKAVGDLIHFKRYEGNLLHIRYFAHNEEDD